MKNFKLAILGLALFGLSACGGSSSNNFSSGAGNFNNNNNNNTPTNNTNPPANQGSFNFTFTTNGNANATPFASGGALTGSTFSTGTPANRLQSTFIQNQVNGQAILVRTLTSTIAKGATLAQGDIFTYANPLATPGAFSDYTEQGQPALKRWVSNGGTLTINSISATTANVTVNNLQLTPAADGGNTATGTITVNGTATLTF